MKCSVAEQLRRQTWSDADRNEVIEIQRISERSACYVLGTAFAHLFRNPAPGTQNKKLGE
jgi:hypothetical protein